MVTWRVHYGDGTTFSDADGDVWDAPATNVVCVAYHTDDPEHGTGHSVVHAFDFYWWDPPDWYGGELFGLFDYLTRPGAKRVLFGRTIPTADYRRILMAAVDGQEFKREPTR